MIHSVGGQHLTIRVELENQPGTFAHLATAIATHGAGLGAVDIISTHNDTIVRDIGVHVRDEEHIEELLRAIKEIPGVHLVNVSDQILQLHSGGKLQITPRFHIKNRQTLAQAYAPGVFNVCRTIMRDPKATTAFTMKRNAVAIITDGSAVIGLGDIGHDAAIPVMEGKAMIYRDFAGIDAFPLPLATRNVDAIVDTIANISPIFGIINLEDIDSSRSHEIQRKLMQRLEMPIFHDVHDGSSIVVVAGLLNALRVVGKDIADASIVIYGITYRSRALAEMLIAAGAKRVVGCDASGAISRRHGDSNSEVMRWFAENTNPATFEGSLADALAGSDVLLGMLAHGPLTPDMVKAMSKDSVVFHIGDPQPNVSPDKLMGIARIVATNRSDTPNQLVSILASPGVLRGILDVNAFTINMAMKLAAARALADTIQPDELSEDHILPGIFNPEVVKNVAKGVAAAALKTEVGRRRKLKIAISREHS